MKTKEYLNLNESIRSVNIPSARKNARYLPESVQTTPQTGMPSELVEEITNVIMATEERLGVELTPEEVAYSTQHIMEQVKTFLVVEEIQNRVGFELNEDEIQYVLNNLNEG